MNTSHCFRLATIALLAAATSSAFAHFQGPGHSWTDMQRPMLFATGDGDDGCERTDKPGECVGDTPFGRRIGQLPAALQWLQSNRIEQASGGVAEWQRK